MNYKFSRALGMAFGLYLSTFVIGIVAGIASDTDMSTMDNTPDWFWYVGMAAAIVLTALFAHLYFKNPAIIPSAKSGLLFGLTAAAFSFLLDLILFSAGNAGGANVDLGEYYGDYRFWIIVVFVILTATIVGANKKTKTHEPSI